MSLLPCPFCGCAGEDLLHIEVDDDTYAYTCPNCNAIGPHDCTDATPATAAWNRRPRVGFRATDRPEILTLGDPT